MLRFGHGSPTVVSAHSLLLHVDAYLHEVAGRDVVDMRLPGSDVAGGRFVVLLVRRGQVAPLVRSSDSLLSVEILHGVSQGVESDETVGHDLQAVPFAEPHAARVGTVSVLLRPDVGEIHFVGLYSPTNAPAFLSV